MNWNFWDNGKKPRDTQECIGVESRERAIVLCYWVEREGVFRVCGWQEMVRNGWEDAELYYLGPFEDADNYILAWIPVDDILKDYFDGRNAND